MKKEKSLSYSLKLLSLICFVTALCFIILLRTFQTDEFLRWYSRYTDSLSEFEIWIETYGATPLAVVIILFNYALKSVMPWFPVSCICVASAVLFKWYQALFINLAGLCILFTLKFLWGRRFGAGNAEKLLQRYDTAHKIIDENKHSSAIALFFLRLIPVLSINSVSCLYGTTDMPLVKFLIVSCLGSVYKLMSYIIIGRNVFDPASASFIMPFIPLLIFSGMVLLSLSGAVGLTEKDKKEKIETN